MTRTLPFAAAAMLVVAACSAPETPETSAKPAAAAADPAPRSATVHVLTAGPGSPEVQTWAQELTAAIESGEGNLVLVSTPEEAEAVVLIESVEVGGEASPELAGEGETYRMRGSLVIGDDVRDFNVVYRGEVRPQAEALARNLPRFAQEAASGGATVDSKGAAPQGEDAGVEESNY